MNPPSFHLNVVEAMEDKENDVSLIWDRLELELPSLVIVTDDISTQDLRALGFESQVDMEGAVCARRANMLVNSLAFKLQSSGLAFQSRIIFGD
jgi:hypothetical protein